MELWPLWSCAGLGRFSYKLNYSPEEQHFCWMHCSKATLKEHNKETNTSLASEGGDLKPVSLLQSSAPCRVEQFCNVWREILDIYQGRCKGDPWHFRNEHTLSKQRFQRGQDRMLSLLWNIQLLKETVFLIDFHQLHSAYRSNFEHKGYFRSHN